MSIMHGPSTPAKCVLILAALAGCARAEQGILVLYVADVEGKALSRVRISVKGDGGTDETKEGKARIRLAPQTKPGSSVTLALLPPTNLVFISPYDERVQVPSFENESANYVSVTLAERGDKRLLEDPAALHAMVKRATDAAAPKTAGEKDSAARAAQALKDVAQQFNLPPDEIDRAIRAWGRKAQDPYDKGLAELYARNYSDSTRDLTLSVEMRREQALQGVADLVEADKSLGQSLRAEGKYRQAAAAYEEANRYRPDDPLILNDWGLNLNSAAAYAEAEPVLRRALAITETTLGPDHPYVAIRLNNLASLLDDTGDYGGAEPLLRRALAIDEKTLGPDHSNVATRLNNLATVLKHKGDNAGAEPLFRRALAINEKALGPDNPDVAIDLNNLAVVLDDKGDYAGAETLYRRALAIGEKTLGPDHPDLATRLSNLAELLYKKGDLTGAEPLLRRALAIDEKALGPSHPFVAIALNNLATVLEQKRDFAAADPLLQRALAIDEKALGPDHPDISIRLSNLGLLRELQGDHAGAEPLLRRALAVAEKALGPDHPNVAKDLDNLAYVLEQEGDYAAAEPLYRRALAIEEKAFGPDHPDTKTIRGSLDALVKKRAAQ